MKKILIFLLVLILIVTACVFYNIKDFFSIARYKELPEENTINIVLNTDTNYVYPSIVMMFSAYVNKNPETKYHFFRYK